MPKHEMAGQHAGTQADALYAELCETKRQLAAVTAERDRLRAALLDICRTNCHPAQTPFQVEQMFHAMANAALADCTKEGT